MVKPIPASQLDLSAVDDLLILCDEVMRATAAGAHRFIEPAPGVLARAKAQQHNMIFGRRAQVSLAYYVKLRRTSRLIDALYLLWIWKPLKDTLIPTC